MWIRWKSEIFFVSTNLLADQDVQPRNGLDAWYLLRTDWRPGTLHALRSLQRPVVPIDQPLLRSLRTLRLLLLLRALRRTLLAGLLRRNVGFILCQPKYQYQHQNQGSPKAPESGAMRGTGNPSQVEPKNLFAENCWGQTSLESSGDVWFWSKS